ncbi:acetylhydrolase [Luteolibacter sp. LG18]|nr:acetylhydrolase [Luteolibacter sp. LG18]
MLCGAVARAQDAPGSPVFPVPQRGMEKRHQQKVEQIRAKKYDLLMIGDSITHNFEKPEYKAVWEQFFAPRNAIDLGYSGGRTENTLWNLQNGELEGQSPKAVTLLIGTNNTDDANYPVVHTPEQVAQGVSAIVKLLREKCPQSKILLLRIFPRTNVYKKPDGSERGSAEKRFAANLRAGELVAKLADGKDVFFLDVNHVFLKPDGTVDPALAPDLLHPGPAGALAWAKAMEPTLSALMGDTPKEPTPANNAVVPVSKLESDSYDWFKRHEDILKAKEGLDPQVVLIGDSITHFWGGQPQSPGAKARGPQAWERAFDGKKTLNLGFGWDRTQNVLWRLDHGEFDGLHPERVVINIGTNNFSGTKNARANTPAEVAEGIREVILRVRSKSPSSKIVLMGVFPRDKAADSPRRKLIAELNALLKAQWGNVPGVTFLDLGAKFLQPDGTLPVELMSDGTHPTEKGYAIWADGLLEL